MTIDITHTLCIGAGLVARSAVHHLYHKLCHMMIHKAGHHVSGFGLILKRAKWLMDAILIGCLAAFGAVTEHEPEPSQE
jgi:hypothetical protein